MPNSRYIFSHSPNRSNYLLINVFIFCLWIKIKSTHRLGSQRKISEYKFRSHKIVFFYFLMKFYWFKLNINKFFGSHFSQVQITDETKLEWKNIYTEILIRVSIYFTKRLFIMFLIKKTCLLFNNTSYN